MESTGTVQRAALAMHHASNTTQHHTTPHHHPSSEIDFYSWRDAITIGVHMLTSILSALAAILLPLQTGKTCFDKNSKSCETCFEEESRQGLKYGHLLSVDYCAKRCGRGRHTSANPKGGLKCRDCHMQCGPSGCAGYAALCTFQFIISASPLSFHMNPLEYILWSTIVFSGP